MNPDTGAIYPSREAAAEAGEDVDRLVMLEGPADQIQKVSQAVQRDATKAQRARRRASNKAARKSRKKNRR